MKLVFLLTKPPRSLVCGSRLEPYIKVSGLKSATGTASWATEPKCGVLGSIPYPEIAQGSTCHVCRNRQLQQHIAALPGKDVRDGHRGLARRLSFCFRHEAMTSRLEHHPECLLCICANMLSYVYIYIYVYVYLWPAGAMIHSWRYQ